MDQPCHIVQGTDRHAPKMKTLAPDSPTFNEVDFFSCSCKPDRRDPSRRATPKDNNHGFPQKNIREILDFFSI
jgi:hypothetical protein